MDMENQNNATTARGSSSSALFDIWYHGCYRGPGHFLRSKKTDPKYNQHPWGYKLDGGLLTDDYYKADTRPTGKTSFHQKEGWSAVSFWDRSGGDERPGCNSTFLVHAEISEEELLTEAKKQWPEIFARKGFPLSNAEKTNSGCLNSEMEAES